MSNKIKHLQASSIEGISKILGDTGSGLSSSVISQYLIEMRIKDVDPAITKWRKLYHALINNQNITQCSNGILNFGKTYTYMEEFRNSGEAEESGTIGVIGFKVLSEESTNIRFEKTNTMPNSISGTYIYNW